jgi:arabinose-5-phosphate isomerase
MNAIERAKRVLRIERAAIDAMSDRLDDRFDRAVTLLRQCTGKVVVIGVGKSGLVGAKIAATLASTGTPAFALHAGDAAHGDLGMVHKNDVALVISNSGETEEVLAVLPALRRLGVPIVAMTGVLDSPLGQTSDLVLDTGVAEEACPLGLAPTASTTAQIAMGDALAVALLEERGFSERDFARVHPAGLLGKRLLTRVSDLMHGGEALPRVTPEQAMMDVLIEMSAKRLGATIVEDRDGRLLGIITDGDLRRATQKHGDLARLKAIDVMTTSPKLVDAGALATRAALLMEQHSISVVLVYEPPAQDRIVGVVHLHDLLKAGII